MQITLIRHLPTEWNHKGLLQGRNDIELSDLFASQEKKVIQNKQQLEKNAPYDIVLASSLKRTWQTAKLYNYTPVMEPLLDELDFGVYEGLPKEKLLRDYEKRWRDQPETIVLGESLLGLENRIRVFQKKYSAFSNILLFGHGAWIRAFLSYNEHGNISNMNKRKVYFNDPIVVKINAPAYDGTIN